MSAASPGRHHERNHFSVLRDHCVAGATVVSISLKRCPTVKISTVVVVAVVVGSRWLGWPSFLTCATVRRGGRVTTALLLLDERNNFAASDPIYLTLSLIHI